MSDSTKIGFGNPVVSFHADWLLSNALAELFVTDSYINRQIREQIRDYVEDALPDLAQRLNREVQNQKRDRGFGAWDTYAYCHRHPDLLPECAHSRNIP